MRLAVTENFILAARSAGRKVDRKVYLRKTNSRSDLLSAGTWIDVSDMISEKSAGGITNAIEANLGSFSASRKTIIGMDIAWWDANIFNYANQLEVKEVYQLNDLTGDTIPIFSGWIEKQSGVFKVTRNVNSNKTQFSVWSYPDYSADLSASSLVTQYIDDDIDGAGADGLVLPHIKSLFVTDANITSFVLKKGVHTIYYQISGGNKQAKLDDGDWVTLTTNDYNLLLNGAGDQKVEVYAKANIPATGEFSDDIIVNVPTDTFPKNWYYTISVRYLLTKLFEKAGIVTINFDTLEYDTADGGKKISFLDLVPNDASITTPRDAIESDGTYLWFGVGNGLYRRNMTTGEYVLKQSLTSGYKIRRLLYNSRNDHLWIFYYTGGNVTKLRRYVISSDTLSAEIAITNAHPQSITISDYSSLLSGYVYSVVYLDTAGYVKEVDGSSLSITTIITTSSANDFVLFKEIERKIYYFRGLAMWRIIRDVDNGTWSDDGLVITLAVGYTRWAYHSGEQRVYFFTSSGAPTHYYIKSHTLSSATITDVIDLGIAGNDNFIDAMFYSAVETAVVFTVSGKDFYLAASNAATLEQSGVYHKWHTMVDHVSRLYGVDVYGRLYHYADMIALYVETADYEGTDVRSAIENVCNSFNLLYNISSTKSARVQRRADSSGNLINSGSSVTLNADGAKDITEESAYSIVYDMVSVDNGRVKVCYDGTNFAAVAFADEKVLPISSELIPDEIIEDIAYNAYQFFSTPKKMYGIPTPIMYWQYESLDGAVLNYTGNITVNNTGLIVGDATDKYGKMEFKVLVKA